MISATRYQLWLERLLVWDGLLPLGVMSLAGAMAAAVPGRNELVDIFCTLLPITAFLLRIAIGSWNMRTWRAWLVQRVFFVVGVLLLLALDICYLFLVQQRGNIDPDGWITLGLMYAAYLSFMAVALFPIHTTEIE
jgi:hypothetical protein